MALVGNILLGTGAAPGMSSIASAYAESAASSRIPWSALEYSGKTITAISGSAIGGQGGGGGDTSQCMPITGMTAYQTVSSISSWTADLSSISSKQDALTFGYSGEYISSINGSAIIDTQGGGGGGVTPEDVSAIASAYADEKLDKTASSTFQPSGNYAYESSLSSYLPGSASSNFAPTGDYAYNSSLSAKLDQSSISAQSATWNTVTAKADATAVHTYTGVSPVVVNNTTNQISLSASSIHLDTSLRSYVSGTSGFIGMAYPMQFVSSSSQATGSNILYVVLGG